MRSLITTFVLCSVGAAQAQNPMQCNEHGAVLTTPRGEVYYLGNQCDAAQKGGGTGRWWLAASNLIIEIDGNGIFLREEHYGGFPCDMPVVCVFAPVQE